MRYSNITKTLTTGRIIIITHKHHVNKPAIILNPMLSTNPVSFKVLVLNDTKTEIDPELPDDWYKMLGLARTDIFAPVKGTDHDVLTIAPVDIFEITRKMVKVNAPLVIKDWEQRQQLRFKNDPPGESCISAVKELLIYTTAAKEDPANTGYLHLIHNLKLNGQELYESVRILYTEKEKCLDRYLQFTSAPNFEYNFCTVFKRRYVETCLAEERNKLQYELSNESMSLYCEYEKRIELLKKLKYVDEQNRGIYFCFQI